jgi:hypothetical protein
MTGNTLCPFFRKNEDYCDVGCGYISPHDVKVMVDYCSSRYTACSKYQQLASRFPQGIEPKKSKEHTGAAVNKTTGAGGKDG